MLGWSFQYLQRRLACDTDTTVTELQAFCTIDRKKLALMGHRLSPASLRYLLKERINHALWVSGGWHWCLGYMNCSPGAKSKASHLRGATLIRTPFQLYFETMLEKGQKWGRRSTEPHMKPRGATSDFWNLKDKKWNKANFIFRFSSNAFLWYLKKF